MLASGLFQGTGKAIRAAVMGLSRQIFALLPCVIIMTLVFGLQGLVRAQAAADVLSFCIAIVVTIPMILELNRLQKQMDENKNMKKDSFDSEDLQ